jgi:hypothetical protein
MNDPVARSALGLHAAPVTIAHVEAIPVKLPLSKPVVCVCRPSLHYARLHRAIASAIAALSQPASSCFMQSSSIRA